MINLILSKIYIFENFVLDSTSYVCYLQLRVTTTIITTVVMLSFTKDHIGFKTLRTFTSGLSQGSTTNSRREILKR